MGFRAMEIVVVVCFVVGYGGVWVSQLSGEFAALGRRNVHVLGRSVVGLRIGKTGWA